VGLSRRHGTTGPYLATLRTYALVLEGPPDAQGANCHTGVSRSVGRSLAQPWYVHVCEQPTNMTGAPKKSLQIVHRINWSSWAPLAVGQSLGSVTSSSMSISIAIAACCGCCCSGCSSMVLLRWPSWNVQQLVCAPKWRAFLSSIYPCACPMATELLALRRLLRSFGPEDGGDDDPGPAAVHAFSAQHAIGVNHLCFVPGGGGQTVLSADVFGHLALSTVRPMGRPVQVDVLAGATGLTADCVFGVAAAGNTVATARHDGSVHLYDWTQRRWTGGLVVSRMPLGPCDLTETTVLVADGGETDGRSKVYVVDRYTKQNYFIFIFLLLGGALRVHRWCWT